MISAVLSSFNEIRNPIFWRNIDLLKDRAQVIVVDGGSGDGTREKLVSLGVPVEVLPSSHRGQRYNLGLHRANHDVVLLIHPRTEISPPVIEILESLDAQGPSWGAFTHSFDEVHPLLRFTSWYSNHVRGDGRGIFYLDHCLYFTRSLKEHAVFPDVELFEDTYFCARLRKISKPKRWPIAVRTSALRFRKNGLWRQAAMNQVLKLLFYVGVSEKWMSRIYERGLSLNIKKD